MNDFETFVENFNATFENSDKERTSINKLWSLHQGPCLIVMYAFEFKQSTCNISWDEIALMSQFQFRLRIDVKNLLLTMLNPMILNQTITQIVQCDNKLFEWCQKKCWEFHHYKKKSCPPHHPHWWHVDDPMQINKRQFKLLMEQDKQWLTNKLCLYYGELNHIANNCSKK